MDGPPVSKLNALVPVSVRPSSDFRPGFSLKLQLTPAGRSDSKS
ncbi:MAG: hypothetical protein WDO56_00805 [Gammaproteobacteria bacterium]